MGGTWVGGDEMPEIQWRVLEYVTGYILPIRLRAVLIPFPFRQAGIHYLPIEADYSTIYVQLLN